jgi:hypothetical protein
MDDGREEERMSATTVSERSDRVMRFVRRNEEALQMATEAAARVAPESDAQRVLVLFDMSEERSRCIVQAGVEAGVVPPVAVSETAEAMLLVVTVDAARGLVEMTSSLPLDRFDSAASQSSAMRAMMLVVLSCGVTFIGCVPCASAEKAKA